MTLRSNQKFPKKVPWTNTWVKLYIDAFDYPGVEIKCKSPFCDRTSVTTKSFYIKRKTCYKCNEQFKTHGKFIDSDYGVLKKCKNPECKKTNKTPKSNFSNGHCSSCWGMLKRSGTYERQQVINQGKTCKEPGCDLPACTKLMCSHHFEKVRRLDPKRIEQNRKYSRSAEGKAKRHAYDISPAGRESSRKSEEKRRNDPVKMQKRREQARTRHQKNPEINRAKDRDRYDTKKRREGIYKSLKKQDEANAKLHGIPVNLYKYRRTNWAAIIKKDYFDLKCGQCGKECTSRELQAHHYFFKSLYRGLEFNKRNGIALCRECHTEFHALNGKGEKGAKPFILALR